MSKIKHNFKEGDKIGNSTFIRRIESKNGQPMALLMCECGKEFETRIYALTIGRTKSCGCLQRKVASEPKKIFEVGQNINGFIYMGDAPYNSHWSRKATFICPCGNEFITTITNIEKGVTKSCGCRTKEFLAESGGLPEKKLPYFSVRDEQRFWGKVNITSDLNECWDWQANGQRYGNFKVKNDTYKANRVAYFLVYNIDPLGLSTRHSCDNPKCCNPTHLSLGTHYENMQDMVKRGRSKRKNKVLIY